MSWHLKVFILTSHFDIKYSSDEDNISSILTDLNLSIKFIEFTDVAVKVAGASK